MSVITIQMGLPGIEMCLSMKTSQAIGRLGELWAKEVLNQRGYDVLDIRGTGGGDLRATRRRTGVYSDVEVKIARQSTDGKWHFQLMKNDRYGFSDHRGADIVLLLVVVRSGRIVPFVVPSEVLASQRQCVITSHPDKYAGKLAKFRQSRKSLKLEICNG